jgi:hypothetical protein
MGLPLIAGSLTLSVTPTGDLEVSGLEQLRHLGPVDRSDIVQAECEPSAVTVMG